MIAKVIITYEDKEFRKICACFMIIRTTEQYTICDHIEISDLKICFIFTIDNIIIRYGTY